MPELDMVKIFSEKTSKHDNGSKKQAMNINIPTVLAWFLESETCILHNHSERIPSTSNRENNIIKDIIGK